MRVNEERGFVMKKKIINVGVLGAGLISFAMCISCASLSNSKTPFEQFCLSFSQEVTKAEQSIGKYRDFVKELSDYEKRVGTLSDPDYESLDSILLEIPDAKQNMEVQIKYAKDIGRSVTADGYYTETKKSVRGWDAVVYTNLHVDTTLGALGQTATETMAKYNSIDLNLLKRPNKPFNANFYKILTEANIEIASAKSDVAAKDWTSGKSAVNRANEAIKRVLKLDLNNIEQYQISLIQSDLKKVSQDISLGSTINKAGSIVEGAAEGAAGILGGLGNILKGIGNKVNE
jgi:hypothetical protein